MTSLDKLAVAQTARILTVQGECRVTSRLMEMGLFEGEEIELVGRAPLGDPLTFRMSGSRIALRSVDARRVHVEVLSPQPSAVPA